MLAIAASKNTLKGVCMQVSRGSIACEPIMIAPPGFTLAYFWPSRNFATNGDQIGMASGEPIK
jgi:hypothetical protein